MRYAAAVGGVVLGLVMSASADAQTTFERGWIDVNLGVAVAAEDAFSMRASGEIFSEQADFGADYSLPRGASFDFGGGVMIFWMSATRWRVSGLVEPSDCARLYDSPARRRYRSPRLS